MKEKKLSRASKTLKIVPFSKFAPPGFKLPKKFRAVVGYGPEKRPAWFLFDVVAFWEFVCRIEARLFEKLPDELYEKVSLGELVDVLERNWPFNKKLQEDIEESYKQCLHDLKSGKLNYLFEENKTTSQ